MHIASAQQVMLRTHIAAFRLGYRAGGLFLESGPGIGKSEAIPQCCEMLAAAINEPVGVVTEMLATYSSVDVRGFMLPTKGDTGALDTVWSTPSWYPKRSNIKVVTPDGNWHGFGEWDAPVPRVGILFLDEFSQAEDDVKKPAAELIYKGSVGSVELPVGWRVIGAGNRTSDRSGVLRELMFIVNRRCKLSIDASLPAWLEWANRGCVADKAAISIPRWLLRDGITLPTRPHYLSISFAQKNPDLVFRDYVPDGTEPFCTPRTLCLLDKDLWALRSDEDYEADRLPTDPIAREVAAGWIGKGEAAQFFTHLKYADQLPDIDDIMKDPSKAKLPEGRDAQMVCAYMLAHNLDEKNAGAVIKYVNRLHREMQVLAIKAVSAQKNDERSKALMAHPEYMAWLMKNVDVLKASMS